MRQYGIYLLYPPFVDLKKEGLGRYLANFLLAAGKDKNVKFIIACPSWLQAPLSELLLDFGVNNKQFEIIAPKTKPAILSVCFSLLKAMEFIKQRKRPRSKPNGFYHNLCRLAHEVFKKIYNTRSMLFLVLLLPFFFFMLAMMSIFQFSKFIISLNHKILENKLMPRLNRYRIMRALNRPKTTRSTFSKKIFKLSKIQFLRDDLETLKTFEAKLLHELIEKRTDIDAWYCPTQFWPEFNRISKPKLMTVPDVVLNDFPIGFAITNPQLKNAYAKVCEAIHNGQYYVTYSEDVKYNTLKAKFDIDPARVCVIRHGATGLDHLIKVNHIVHEKEISDEFCWNLFKDALDKSVLKADAFNTYKNSKLKFMFYASQVRPNKNMLQLLKVYNYLLRQRFIDHKLILTGNPEVMPELVEYTVNERLENDVLWLHGISSQQLAACYKLADLAVNPSLSEGGFPFTFTEALSVDTPIVMASINVTTEILKAPALTSVTLFDPYDWKDMANKIEWALQNKEQLLALQKPYFNELAKRTWNDVVSEHIEILDRISGYQKPTVAAKETADVEEII